MQILLVNGPPRVGKDTLGELCVEHLFHEDGNVSIFVEKFARILKERTHALYGYSEYEHDHFEKVKDEPCDEFYGVTPRKAYQSVSENLMKPLHGESIFGTLLADDIDDMAHEMGSYPDLVVITDSGFHPEAREIIRRFHGGDNITLVRLHRKGCTFEGDTRGYIDLASEGVPGVDLTNDGPKEELWHKLIDAVPQIRRMAT